MSPSVYYTTQRSQELDDEHSMLLHFLPTASKTSTRAMPSSYPSSYSSSFGKGYTRAGPVNLCDDPFLESDSPVWIDLIVIPANQTGSTPFTTQRETHWCLSWELPHEHGYSYSRKARPQRRLHNAEDALFNSEIGCSKIDEDIRRGPITQVVHGIKEMSRKDRDLLKDIAEAVPLQGSACRCQDWCIAVLEEAQKQGIFTKQEPPPYLCLEDDNATEYGMLQLESLLAMCYGIAGISFVFVLELELVEIIRVTGIIRINYLLITIPVDPRSQPQSTGGSSSSRRDDSPSTTLRL
ncbi:hypothetical protein CCMSSC00406_0006966 [Pleurotus cornucopiae]|uniref:Uncharacterized protein n=1 Tax=Pleurotus cornucopiae TaxID=5321 RepID=A0ACB7J0E3_PLECO|nr:hypothetical protein CCMSSC00406_0006966 [Pleurotus cornucopiae]